MGSNGVMLCALTGVCQMALAVLFPIKVESTVQYITNSTYIHDNKYEEK